MIRSARHSQSSPTRWPGTLFLGTMAFLAIIMATPDGAGATKLRVNVFERSQAGPALVRTHVAGARRARNVSLFVDGRLRRRDRSFPWGFGSGGWLRMGRGHHRVAVVARFGRHAQVRRRAVLVRGEGSLATSQDNRPKRRSRSDGRQSRVGVSRGHSAERTRQQPPAPAPEPEPEPDPQPGDEGEWRGDFETGNLSQWDMIQRADESDIEVLRDPVRQGNHAARFEVSPDDNIGNTDPRAEVAARLGEKEGAERYYRWFTYFDQDFPTSYDDEFVTFTQWRAEDESEAFTSFMLWGDQIELRRDGTRWSTELEKGVWHEFIYHVKWSPDSDVGFIELWYDGELVLPKLHVRTMAGSPGDAVSNYVKQGLYKADEIPTGVVYHDGFTVGRSLAEVR